MRFMFLHLCTKALRVDWVVLGSQLEGNVIFVMQGSPQHSPFPLSCVLEVLLVLEFKDKSNPVIGGVKSSVCFAS